MICGAISGLVLAILGLLWAECGVGLAVFAFVSGQLGALLGALGEANISAQIVQ